MADLLPCPFCKTVPNGPFQERKAPPEYVFRHWCAIGGNVWLRSEDAAKPWTEKQAIKAWNRRAQISAPHLTPAQAAGLAAGTHVVVPVDVLLAVLDEAAADSIYASCKCLSPDEAAISRHHQERIEQLRGLAAAQKEG